MYKYVGMALALVCTTVAYASTNYKCDSDNGMNRADSNATAFAESAEATFDCENSMIPGLDSSLECPISGKLYTNGNVSLGGRFISMVAGSGHRTVLPDGQIDWTFQGTSGASGPRGLLVNVRISPVPAGFPSTLPIVSTAPGPRHDDRCCDPEVENGCMEIPCPPSVRVRSRRTIDSFDVSFESEDLDCGDSDRGCVVMRGWYLHGFNCLVTQ